LKIENAGWRGFAIIYFINPLGASVNGTDYKSAQGKRIKII
jgi:hypothetical protein